MADNDNPAEKYTKMTKVVESDAGKVEFYSADEAIKMAEYEQKTKNRRRGWARIGKRVMKENRWD